MKNEMGGACGTYGGGGKNMCSVVVGKCKRKRTFGRPGIKLNCMLKKQDGRTLSGLMCVRMGTVGSEHWAPVNGGYLLTS